MVVNIVKNIGTIVRKPVIKEVFQRALLHEPWPSNTAHELSNLPQMVVLFTWVGAKEKTAHKFLDSWRSRGFYVLHITTTVMDLVIPKRGTEITAMRVAEFLSRQENCNIIIHGLSVGGYLGQRVIQNLHSNNERPKITHQIYDSFTNVAGFQSGVENAVKPRFRSLVRTGVKLYTKIADLECLYETSRLIREIPTPSPALFMHSLSDNVGRYEYIDGMLPYMAKTNPISTFILPKAEKIPHVALFRHMGEGPYMSVITRFLQKNNFQVRNKKILQEEDPQSDSAQKNESKIKLISPHS